MAATMPIVVFLAMLHAVPFAVANAKLELVSMVFRHGDRSPVRTFPTDRYQESYWPQGFGQLTQIGMLQQYDLGQYLRHRYMTPNSDTHLLNGTYSREEVSIRSTDVDRTLMSVESQMAAFYKPIGRQMFLKNLTWQPVPVHTVPVSEDSLLRAYSMDCPRYKKLRKEKRQDADWIQLMNRNKDLLEFVESKTGVDYKLDPDNIYEISDAIFCEMQHGLSPPQWYTDERFETLNNISDFGVFKMFEGREINKLTSGIFINHVLTHMQQKRNHQGDAANKKMFVYSAHDTTVAAILSGLGVYDKETPPYASILMIELYSQSGKYFVKVFYHKGPSADISVMPQLLPIPKCASPCPLDDFAQLMTPVLLTEDQFEHECETCTDCDSKHLTSTHVTSTTRGLAVGVAVLGLVLVVIAICVVWSYSRRHRTRRHSGSILLTRKDEEELSDTLSD